MQLQDLQVSADLGRQVIDLYSDLVNLIFHYTAPTSEYQDFQRHIKSSNLHVLIQDKFGLYANEIS